MSDHTNDQPVAMFMRPAVVTPEEMAEGQVQRGAETYSVARLDPIHTLGEAEAHTEDLRHELETILGSKIEAVESVYELVTITEKVAACVGALQSDFEAIEMQGSEPLTKQDRINTALEVAINRANRIR